MMKYKNSKKRCNLYVKNFPGNTTKEQLQQLFEKYGEIESIKVFYAKDKPDAPPTAEKEALYAFVCFKNPESASKAKAELHTSQFNGKQIYINHYEIKEQRKAQIEEIKDKADFENYRKTTTNVSNEFMANPQMLSQLTLLIQQLLPKL